MILIDTHGLPLIVITAAVWHLLANEELTQTVPLCGINTGVHSLKYVLYQ